MTKTYHIFPGSLELSGTIVTAGVHTGPSEFVPENLRYVSGDGAKGLPDDTLNSFLIRIYETSEGCIARGDFKMKEL